MPLTPLFLAAILIAVVAAAFLAIGTHLQHAAVRKDSLTPEAKDPVVSDGSAAADRAPAPEAARTTRLSVLTRPVWLAGTGLIMAETVLNVLALGLAPVALVQPVGALALVFAVLISTRALRVPVTRGLLLAVALTIGSVAVFVGTSARYSLEPTVTETAQTQLTVLLLAGSVAALLLARSRLGHLPRIAGAAVLFGTVAAGAHLAAAQVLASPALSPSGPPFPDRLLTGQLLLEVSPAGWWLIATLAPASAAGMWLVQTAYASGPPETVLAGLTVIDPLTAVGVGAFLLGEYAPMTPGTLFLLLTSGLMAFCGIALLVRHHPGLAGTAPEPAPRSAPAPAVPSRHTVHGESGPRRGVPAQNRRS